MSKKRLAIHFYGFVRTFKKTHKSFFKNIIAPNSDDFEIDIFMHFWDKFNVTDENAWHKTANFFPQ